MSIFKTIHWLADCDLIQVKLFHLPMDKQILKKHLSCAVKYLVGQVGHGISTGLHNNNEKLPVKLKWHFVRKTDSSGYVVAYITSHTD